MFRTTSIITGLAGILSLASCTEDATAQPGLAGTEQSVSASECPPNTPSALAPAADQDLAFVLNAQGVQRYQCVQSTTGFAWTFVAPDADLFSPHPAHPVVHHFSGPTWLYRDSSSVVAAKLAGVTVDPTAVQWLLLNVTSHGGEHGKLSDIVSIQRLQTTGGNAPATGCDADHVGAESDVLYTARYFFYRTSNRPNNVRCGG
ncbi:MAG TPA: DUF3455 domain-containing protein [Kofleriaceae bacterium]|nr:DUF3455 domain-containing protein [Kofleriaceae bacterium]